jgi:hypothetical protein
MKKKFLGQWTWTGNNQTGTWIFYENDTLKTEFAGQYGAGTVDLWIYEIFETEICFKSPSDPLLTPGCYGYVLSEDDTVMTVTYNMETAVWYKIV